MLPEVPAQQNNVPTTQGMGRELLSLMDPAASDFSSDKRSALGHQRALSFNFIFGLFTPGERAMDVTGIEAHSLESKGRGRQIPYKQVAVDGCGEHYKDRHRA